MSFEAGNVLQFKVIDFDMSARVRASMKNKTCGVKVVLDEQNSPTSAQCECKLLAFTSKKEKCD